MHGRSYLNQRMDTVLALSFILQLVILCVTVTLYNRIRVNERLIRSLSTERLIRPRRIRRTHRAVQAVPSSSKKVCKKVCAKSLPDRPKEISISSFARVNSRDHVSEDHIYMSMKNLHQRDSIPGSSQYPFTPPNSTRNSSHDLYNC